MCILIKIKAIKPLGVDIILADHRDRVYDSKQIGSGSLGNESHRPLVQELILHKSNIFIYIYI